MSDRVWALVVITVAITSAIGLGLADRRMPEGRRVPDPTTLKQVVVYGLQPRRPSDWLKLAALGGFAVVILLALLRRAPWSLVASVAWPIWWPYWLATKLRYWRRDR